MINASTLSESGQKMRITKHVSLTRSSSGYVGTKAMPDSFYGTNSILADDISLANTGRKSSLVIIRPKMSCGDFLEEHPELKPFITIYEPQNFILSKDQLRIKIRNSILESSDNIGRISDRLINLQKTIFQRKSQEMMIMNEIRNKSVNGCTRKERVSRYLLSELNLQLLIFHEKYLDSITDFLMKILNFINLLQTTQPDSDLKINLEKIIEKMFSFPKCSKEGQIIVRNIQRMKSYLSTFEHKSLPKVRFLLKNLFNEISIIYRPELCYFPDSGCIESKFTAILSLMPKEFQSELAKHIKQCVVSPAMSGVIIIEQGKTLIQQMFLRKDQILSYLFLLFSRFYFASIYINYSINFQILGNVTTESIVRVKTLRKLTPFGFGLTKKYFPNPFLNTPLVSFPEDNPYSDAIGLFQMLRFMIEPIDFCYTIHKALKSIQQVSSQISIKSNEENAVFSSNSEHLLSLDDLFEISLIILLISAPYDLMGIISALGPYVEGLKMPSELDFAYTNIKALSHHILSLNLEELVQNAEKKIIESNENA